jgi:hypothetical protein
MTLGQAIGADPIGALFDEAVKLAALNTRLSRKRCRFIARRIAKAVRRGGETVLLLSKDETKTWNGMIGLHTLRDDVALSGEMKISDYTLTIPAQPLISAGFPAPLVEGVLIYRFSNQSTERGIRIFKEPQVLAIEDKHLLYRCVGQG